MICPVQIIVGMPFLLAGFLQPKAEAKFSFFECQFEPVTNLNANTILQLLAHEYLIHII